ncbi:MAG: hypothetical protein ACRDP1_00550 [Nocardioidaceae bacterium]
MTWDAYHRRDDILRRLDEVADRHRDGRLPWNEIDAASVFDSTSDLLLAVQMRWHTRLSGRIDRELMNDPMDLRSAIARAWRHAAADLPGMRAILDAHDDVPALGKARDKELGYLASAAGLAAMDDPDAVGIGFELRDDARSIVLDRQPPAGHRAGWLGRLRHTCAA